jgi:hypothetical protein
MRAGVLRFRERWQGQGHPLNQNDYCGQGAFLLCHARRSSLVFSPKGVLSPRTGNALLIEGTWSNPLAVPFAWSKQSICFCKYFVSRHRWPFGVKRQLVIHCIQLCCCPCCYTSTSFGVISFQISWSVGSAFSFGITSSFNESSAEPSPVDRVVTPPTDDSPRRQCSTNKTCNHCLDDGE